MERESNEAWPSQYLEDVNKGGVADMAGLKKGDYLLEASYLGFIKLCWLLFKDITVI